MNYDEDDYEAYLTEPLREEHKEVVEEYLKRLGELIQEVVQLRATEKRLTKWNNDEREKVRDWRKKYNDALKEAVAESKAESESARDDYNNAKNSLEEARKVFDEKGKSAKVGECVWIVYPKYSARDEFVVFKSHKKALEYAKADKSRFADKHNVKKAVVL